MPLLCAISDTHGQHLSLHVPDADILIHAGDFSLHGAVDEVVEFLQWMNALPHIHKVLIAGNHDEMPEAQLALFRTLLAQHAPSITYLEDSGALIMGLRFWGSPWTPRYQDWFFNAKRGPDMQSHWDMIPSDTQVLVTHGPALGILDYLPHEANYHVGCANLATTIRGRLADLRLHCFGHIHAPGGNANLVDGSWRVNASVVNEGYSIANHPILIPLDD